MVLLGEITNDGPQVNYEQVVRKVCCEVGFDAECKGLDGKSCAVILNV